MSATLPPPLVQVPPLPLAAPRVVDLLTGLVALTTNLPPSLVRPRWQPQAPQQPVAGTSWAAVGVTRRLAMGFTWQGMATLPGTTTAALLQRRWSTFEALASFYGPSAEDVAEQFRDAAQLNQNLAALSAAGIKLTWVDEVIAVPDLVNTQWIDHQDVRFEMTREIDRYYPMQPVETAIGTLVTDDAGYELTVNSAQAGPPPG